MKNINRATYLIAAVFSILVGYFFSTMNWKGHVFVYIDDGRTPAAIRKAFDFSHLDGAALELASQMRLLKDATVQKGPTGLGVELGHFVTKSKTGKKVFACSTFDKIEMVFHAEGISVSGEPSVMTVEGGCKISKNIHRIVPIWIPTQRILSEKPSDLELRFLDKNPVALKFSNIPSEWPRTWGLQTIRLYNSASPGHQLYIDQAIMRGYDQPKLSLKF